MASPYVIATHDASAVLDYTRSVFGLLGWNASEPLLNRVFTDTHRLFGGKFPGFRAIDMRYHDLEHTLQATVCAVDILRGRDAVGAPPRLSERDGALLVVAALLHDSGFLKTADDDSGTGAKYTMVHERRSCQFVRAYLPSLGFSTTEVEDVCMAISCTGPRNRISHQSFSRPEAHLLACMLVTADYVAQMSAPGYADKLEHLFREFCEAFAHEGIPPERQPFQSLDQLRRGTSDFWHKFVLPMLESEAGGVLRYLSPSHQPNPYLLAVEENLAEVRRRLLPGPVVA